MFDKKIKLWDIASLDYGYWASGNTEKVWPKFLRITDVTSDYINREQVPYCEIEEKDIPKYKLESWDIVIARTGATAWYAKTIRDPHDAIFAGYLIRARINKDLADPWYVWPIIESEIFKKFIERNKWGAAQPHANVPVIREFYFPLPALAIQRKIASIISNYNDLLENNRQRITILEEQLQFIYEEQFVKFQFSGHDKLEMVDSGTEFGKIPDGWQVKNLYDVADIKMWFAFKSNEFNSEWLWTPVIRIRDIPNKVTKTYTTQEVSSDYMVRAWDILIWMDGFFYLEIRSWQEGYLVQRVCRIRSSEVINNWFLFESLRKPIAYFEATISWTTVAHLGAKDLKKVNILLPWKKHRHLIDIFNLIYSEIVYLEKENTNLKTCRDILIPKLVSGEILV